jgi:hypothetical protein
VGHVISRQLLEEFWWFRASSVIFTLTSEEEDERLLVQAAVDVVALVRYGSQEWPQAAKAANFPS